MAGSRLEVTEMGREDCEDLLRDRSLGRIAYSFRDRVDIQPIGFAYRDGWLFGRTSEGGKLTTVRHNRWVALQVDDIRDMWNWDSVVVRGAIHLLDGEGGEERAELRRKALDALVEAVPGAFGDADPAPHRSVVFGLAPHEIVGRRARLVPAPEATGPDRTDTASPSDGPGPDDPSP